jgi:hypothetical protein
VDEFQRTAGRREREEGKEDDREGKGDLLGYARVERARDMALRERVERRRALLETWRRGVRGRW